MFVFGWRIFGFFFENYSGGRVVSVCVGGCDSGEKEGREVVKAIQFEPWARNLPSLLCEYNSDEKIAFFQ